MFLEVYPNAPTGAPVWTSVWYSESDMAVTDDPESTSNSTEWSPIHPSRNQCPAPEICSTESSTWFVYGESGRSISEPVCVVSTGLVSARSGIVKLSVVWALEAPVDCAVFWSRNRTEFLMTESLLWWELKISDVCVESGDDDEMWSWWMAFRPVWVRSRSKWRFPVGNWCSTVVDHLTACSSPVAWTVASNPALGNELAYIPSDRTWNTWFWWSRVPAEKVGDIPIWRWTVFEEIQAVCLPDEQSVASRIPSF